MIDIRPVAYIIGWILLLLGGLMVVPMVLDLGSAVKDSPSCSDFRNRRLSASAGPRRLFVALPLRGEAIG